MTVFGQSIHFDFFFLDDYFHIVDNLHIDLNWENFKWMWSHSKSPIPYNVWQIIGELFGVNNPTGFRMTNILIHAVNSVLVYKIIFLLFNLRSKEADPYYKALCGALIFLVHPLQVESVVWISSLRGLLAGFFALGAISLCLKNNRVGDAKSNFSILALYSLSILCKPSAISLPFAFVLLDVFIHQLSYKDIFKRNILYFIMCGTGIYLFSTDVVIKLLGMSLINNVLLAFDSFVTYIINYLLPYDLSVGGKGVPIKTQTIIEFSRIFIGIVIILFLGICIYLDKKKSVTNITLGVLFFLIFFLPISGIINFHFQMISTVADRYMYLPILGLIVVTLELTKILHGRFQWLNYKHGLTILFIVGLTGFNQVDKWKDEEILINSKHSGSFYYQMMLGSIFLNKGEPEKAKDYYLKARSINSSYLDSNIHLMKIYAMLNDLEAGEKLAASLGPKLFEEVALYSSYLTLLSINELDAKAIELIGSQYRKNRYNINFLNQYTGALKIDLNKKKNFLKAIQLENKDNKLDAIEDSYKKKIKELELQLKELEEMF